MARTTDAARLADALAIRPADIRKASDLDPSDLRALVAGVRAATHTDDPDVTAVATMLVASMYRPDVPGDGIRAIRAAVKTARRRLASLAPETYGAPADLTDDQVTHVYRAATPDGARRYDYSTADLIETTMTYVARNGGGWTLASAVEHVRANPDAPLSMVQKAAQGATVLPRPEYLQSLTDGGTGYTAHPTRTSATHGDRTPAQGAMPDTVTIRRADGTVETRALTEWEADLQAGRLDRNGYPRHLGYGDPREARDETGNTDPGHAWRDMANGGPSVPSGKVPASPRKKAGTGSTGPTVPVRLAR